MEEHLVGTGPLALDDLVFEFQNQTLGALESNTLYAFDPVDVLAEDGLPQFFCRERRQHHPCGIDTDSIDADD